MPKKEVRLTYKFGWEVFMLYMVYIISNYYFTHHHPDTRTKETALVTNSPSLSVQWHNPDIVLRLNAQSFNDNPIQ